MNSAAEWVGPEAARLPLTRRFAPSFPRVLPSSARDGAVYCGTSSLPDGAAPLTRGAGGTK